MEHYLIYKAICGTLQNLLSVTLTRYPQRNMCYWLHLLSITLTRYDMSCKITCHPQRDICYWYHFADYPITRYPQRDICYWYRRDKKKGSN